MLQRSDTVATTRGIHNWGVSVTGFSASWGASKVDGNRSAAFAVFVVGFVGVEGFVEGGAGDRAFGDGG